MPVTASALRKLASLNLSAEQMVGVIEMLADTAEADEARKSAQRDRTRRSRTKRDGNVTVTSQSHDGNALLSPKETSPTPPKEITPILAPNTSSEVFSPARQKFADPAIILQAVLDPMTAKAFTSHLAQRRKPLSAQSAESVVATLKQIREQGGNPTEAARFTIDKNWVSIDIEYLRNAGFKFTAPKPPDAIDWASRLEVFYTSNTWATAWGPKPGETGCKAPADMITHALATVGRAA